MPKNMKLLLIENVDSLGIVGDVVSVRTGYARNFLLPRALATEPSEELVQTLAAKRAEAERQVAQQRAQREETTAKLEGVELELVRSCNDQGILYGAITQQDVATELTTRGYLVKPRDVRLPGAIKRVDKYELHIKLDTDLDAIVKLVVKPDRELPKDAAPAEEKGGERPEREERERRGSREEREDKREKAMRRRADAIEQAIQSDKARVVGWAKKDAPAEGAAPEGAPAPAAAPESKSADAKGDKPKGKGKDAGEKKSKK
ncbi:MAG: 50S ribosomal protein L9 [Planctomycetota bacterium]|nr:50S ribosomal protein L9 [Planctomycetota bacterium]